MGRVTFVFVPRNDYGVLDHDVAAVLILLGVLGYAIYTVLLRGQPPRRRRRCARLLGRPRRGVPRLAGAALLVPQVGECPCCAAEIGAPGREEVPGRDLGCRGQDPRAGRGEGLRRRLSAKLPKAVAKITDDLEQLVAFYDYPAEHWVHLRTTNPIESTFATVRHRTKVTRGPGSRAAGLAMAFKLIMAAQDRWRAVNAPHLVALVRAGATFINGRLAERPGEQQDVDSPPVETAA